MSNLKQTTLPYKGLIRPPLFNAGSERGTADPQQAISLRHTEMVFDLNQDPFADRSQNVQAHVALVDPVSVQLTCGPHEMIDLTQNNTGTRIRSEEEIKAERVDNRDGEVPPEYLERLAAFENGQNRICNMMRFMIRAGRSNEEFLRELNRDFGQQNIQVQTTQEAFVKFYRDTHSWAGFVNTALEFSHSHFAERTATLSKEISEASEFIRSLYSGIKEKVSELEQRLGTLEAKTLQQNCSHTSPASPELELRVAFVERELGNLGKELSLLNESIPRDCVPQVLHRAGTEKEGTIQTTKVNNSETFHPEPVIPSDLMRDLSGIEELSLVQLRRVRNVVNKKIRTLIKAEREPRKKQSLDDRATQVKKDQKEQQGEKNPPKNSTPNSKPCWFFAKGKCTYGERCRFSHTVKCSTKDPSNLVNEKGVRQLGRQEEQKKGKNQAQQPNRDIKRPPTAGASTSKGQQRPIKHAAPTNGEGKLQAALVKGLEDLRVEIQRSLIRPSSDERCGERFRRPHCSHHCSH